MAKRGEVIHNPVTGETIIFRQTAGDTDGRLLQIALLAGNYQMKTCITSVPILMQKALPVLAPLARLLGYKAVYKTYSGFEK